MYFRTVTQLLQRSVHHGESNSLLVIGPRGVGKSWVVNIECFLIQTQTLNIRLHAVSSQLT